MSWVKENNPDAIIRADLLKYSAKFGILFLMIIPVIIGNVVIAKIPRIILLTDRLENVFAPVKWTMEKLTITGKVNTASKLMTAVSETDKAVSPLARYVNKLEVTPPGQAEIIITPTAKFGSNGHIDNKVKATMGKKKT